MSDIITQVNVAVNPYPTNITVSEIGVAGPPGTPGSSASSSIAGVTGISVTGSAPITGLVNISGKNIVNTILFGDTIIFSGDTSSFLTTTSLQATGTLLYNFSSNISGNLQNTGQSLVNLIAQTGSALDNKINSLSGNLSNLSSIKITGGAVLPIADFSGLNNIYITNSGQKVYVSGDTSNFATSAQITTLTNNLFTTGSTLDTKINVTNTNLGQSGANLYSFSSSISGNLNTTNSNLQTTGSNLSNLINSLSGQLNITGSQLSAVQVTGSATLLNVNFTGRGNVTVFNTGDNFVFISGDISTLATNSNLASTGSVLSDKIISLSGQVNTNLFTSGANLYSYSSSISGNLASTGSVLSTLLNTTITNLGTTGSSLSSRIDTVANNLTTSGVNLYSYSSSISGNLFTTGSTLDNKINTTNTNLASTGSVLSTLLNSDIVNLTSTGSQLYSYSSSISGNLVSTGSALANLIAGLSGQLVQSGSSLSSRLTTQENLPKVTGINITGSPSLTGLVTFTGCNNLLITYTGNSIQFSGDTSILATQNQLTSTGVSLINLINGISGAFNLSGSNLSSRITTQENIAKVTGISNTGLSLTGLVGFSAGANITLTNLDNTIQIASTAGGGSTLLGTITGSGSFGYISKFVHESGLAAAQLIESGCLLVSINPIIAPKIAIGANGCNAISQALIFAFQNFR